MADKSTFYKEIASNKRRTFFVMFGFVAFVSLVAWVIGEGLGYGYSLLAPAFAFSGFSAVGSYFFSDKMVLLTAGAHPVEKKENFELYSVVENVALGAGIHTPKVYYIDSAAPNAFATGRDPDHAVVCVTRGLLEKLDRTELEGVIAHEISHIRDFDILLMSVVAILVGTVALLAEWSGRMSLWGGRRRSSNEDRGNGGNILALLAFLAIIFSPIIAQLIKLALSRQREFLADAAGAKITRFPEGLARALEKIANDKTPLESASAGTAHLYIVSPLKGARFAGRLSSLFSTHPPIEERIARLRAM